MVVAGEVGAEVNTADLTFRWTSGWNDELDRLYFVYDRFDDMWDRDAGGVGGAGGDDSFEINLDANHGGDVSWFGADDFDTEEEVLRNRGPPQPDEPLPLATDGNRSAGTGFGLQALLGTTSSPIRAAGTPSISMAHMPPRRPSKLSGGP